MGDNWLGMKHFVSVSTIIMTWVMLNGLVHCQRPLAVRIGAVYTFDSVIGRAAKAAMESAVSDVNADPLILNGTELKLIMEDANCSVFLGSMGAFQVLDKEVVALLGPQSSAIAHTISEISNALQVPLVSYAATDPTLSSLQFPFFLRTTFSDSQQMAAMADLVDFYGWKDAFAIYVDDDYGRNGIYALGDEFAKKKLRIIKLPLPIDFNLDQIFDLLNGSRLFGPRVYVVHVNPDPTMRIFTVAQRLQMMTSDYVWLATDWLCTTLDSLAPINQTFSSVLLGVVGLRQHSPDSRQKRSFVSQWRKLQQEGAGNSGLNSYALHAYDTVWTVAQSIDKFIKVHRNITFSSNDKLLGSNATGIQLAQLKVFDGGSHLVSILLQTNFTGVSGRIQFSSDRNLIISNYDVINVNQNGTTTVGYWSNYSGFSVVPPETLKEKRYSRTKLDQKLKNVTWPGGKTEKPRGWVIADKERPLRIVIPRRTSFVEFVTEVKDSHKIQGYCIDIFLEAKKLIPYDIPYIFEPFGDGQSNPNYDALVKMVADGVFGAAVGDITIVMNRTKIIDFSQPYASTGLVMVAPVNDAQSSAWVFLQPFTWEMWCVTLASFFLIAVVIWILEHRVNDEFRGPPKRQLATMFLFSFSTLFKKNQENTVSPLGRMVMVVWLFVLMVISASYTANLTSILTVKQLSSPITGIDSLIASNWRIGYQVGSFAYSYLTDSLYIPRSRLISLRSPEEYESALRQGPDHGGVAAIIDELTYVELFLSNRTDFGIIGQPFTKSGWGFAFQRDSPLAIDMSTAILRLSENGKLQKIREKWFCQMGCPGERRRESESNQLHLISFWGLYLSCGIVALAALLVFLLRTLRQYICFKEKQRSYHSSSSTEPSGSRCSRFLYNFFNFIDEKEEAIKRMFVQHENPQGQVM